MDSKNNTYLSLLIFYHVNKSKTNKKTPFQMEGRSEEEHRVNKV